VGRKEPGFDQGAVVEPEVGEEAAQILRTLGVGRVMDDGLDEDETRATRLDGWIIWETNEWATLRTLD